METMSPLHHLTITPPHHLTITPPHRLTTSPPHRLTASPPYHPPQGAPNFTTSVTRTAKAAGEYSWAKIEREAQEVKEDIMGVVNSAKQVAALDPRKVAGAAAARAKTSVMGKMKLPGGKLPGGSLPGRGSTPSSSAAGGAAPQKTMSLDRSKLNFRYRPPS